MSTPSSSPRRGSINRFLLAAICAALGAVGALALLMNIFERKQEAKQPFFRVVELTDDTTDPAIWGRNFPLQYDDYKRTVDQQRTRFGGSEALPRTPPMSIRAASSRSRRSKRTRASKRCGPATPSPRISARNAVTPTCSPTRPSPTARRS